MLQVLPAFFPALKRSTRISLLRVQRERLQSQIADVVVGNGRLESQLKLLQAQRLKEPKASREVLQQRRKLLRNLIALIREERTLRTSAQENNAQRVDLLHARKEELGMLDTMMQQECDITNAEAQRTRANIEELGRRHALLERDAADLRSRVATIQRPLAKEVDEAIKEKLKDELETLRADGDKLKEDKDRVERELAAARNELKEKTSKNALDESALAKTRAELANMEQEIRRWLEEALAQIQQKQAELDAQQQTIDAERGRANEAERSIAQMEQSQGVMLAQVRAENTAEQERFREELRAAHEQELETLRTQLTRFEGIEAGCALLQTDYTALAREKEELERRLTKKISDLLADIDSLNENLTLYNSKIKKLEPLVQKTQDQERELDQLRQDVRDGEALNSAVQRHLDEARAQLAELRGLGSPQQDITAAQEAEREAEEASRKREFIALNSEFKFHLTGAHQFDAEGNYSAALSELDLAESACKKLYERMPPQLAEQFKNNIRLLRDKITAQASGMEKTVWVLVAVGPKESIRWGYVKKNAEQTGTATAADKFDLEAVFPDLTNMFHTGFILSSEKLLKDSIKIGKSPSASDIIIHSNDPSMKISPVHVGLKLRKDSSELLVVSNNDNTMRTRAGDKTWEILPQGRTAALQSANQLILGRDLNLPVWFILAPIAVKPGHELYRLSDVPFLKFWISFTAPTIESPPMPQVELPQEVGVLVPKTRNYDIKLMCGETLVEDIILFKKNYTIGRNPEADIFITAQHKDDIRTISRNGCIIEHDNDGNYSIKLVKEDSYGGVFIFGTEKEGKYNENVTRYRKVEGALALSDGMEFCLDRDGEFCFVFSKKNRSAVKAMPDFRKWRQVKIHYGEAKQQRVVGFLKPEGEFEIFVDNKKLSTDRIMLWKDSTLIGKNPDCDIKLVAPMLISFPKVESLVEASSVISRHHAVIKFKDGEYTLYDNSTYGTFVQGRLVGKGSSVTLQDDFLIWFASNTMTVKFMTHKIPESEIPKEVKQAALVFTQKPASAAEPELPPTKADEARQGMESARVNAIFVQPANADVVVDGRPLDDPKYLEIIKPVLSIGAKETNDIVLHCDVPKLQSLLRDKQARIEIRPNGEVYLVVLRQLLKSNKVFIDGKPVETRSEQVIKIVPDLLHEKKTFVSIGFGDPSIELVYNITTRKTISKAGRQWKQAIVSFKIA
ncbi:FHA domain-containing protein [Candidatus Woesearchaeota archaeon]|nr:FHA domain-containing protein [Candidatus Woesearchaeota archaeon]